MIKKNSILLFMVLSIWLFLTNTVTAQDNVKNNKLTGYHNSVKGMVTLFPMLGAFFEASLSLGYEFRINMTSSIEITGSYLHLIDEMGISTKIVTIMPGYNYYFKKQKQKGPHFRVGTYFRYSKKLADEYGDASFSYGPGMLAGIRLNISKNHRWALDLAFGGSYDYKTEYSLYFLDVKKYWKFTARPVVQIAYKF